jgi:transglutaminase-like putative cysteine protease
MRLAVRHETIYRYATPAKRAIEVLRLQPRGHNGQFVTSWRIDISADCRLDQSYDAFGNVIHNFSVDGPISELAIVAEGSVETVDTAGTLSGEIERFPPVLYLRNTALTTADRAVRDFAEAIAARAAAGRLDLMHALMDGIREQMRFEVDATNPGTSAAEAFALGHGVCQDFAHVFIAACRHLGVPARYAGGYLLQTNDSGSQSAGHAWAEALIDDFGWVGFDPANGISPTDAYVRVAIGLDYLGAAPVRGTIFGGSGETLAVSVSVRLQSGSGATLRQVQDSDN